MEITIVVYHESKGKFSNFLLLHKALFIEVDRVIKLAEVKSIGTERKLEHLKCFHELWVDTISARGACFFA